MGGASHVAGVFFQNEIGAHFQFVPYRDAGPAMNVWRPGRSSSWSIRCQIRRNTLSSMVMGLVKGEGLLQAQALRRARAAPTASQEWRTLIFYRSGM
jgi:hypothetical protein